MNTDRERIETITMYRTRDGEEFHSMEAAEDHADALDRCEKANVLLRAGHSLVEVYETATGSPLPAKYHPLLSATRHTGIVIKHWQGSSRPNYSVVAVRTDGVMVAGIGGWSGRYGEPVKWIDLARYVSDTIERFGVVEVTDNPAYQAHLERMAR